MRTPEEPRPERPEKSKPKSISELSSEEREDYFNVPGWRVWPRNIFSRDEYIEAAREAEEKPLALLSHQGEGGEGYDLYNTLLGRLQKAQNIPIIFGRGSTDLPSFLLEPLTEEEVQRIDDEGEAPGPLGSTDRPKELLRPNDLRALFSSKKHDTEEPHIPELFYGDEVFGAGLNNLNLEEEIERIEREYDDHNKDTESNKN